MPQLQLNFSVVTGARLLLPSAFSRYLPGHSLQINVLPVEVRHVKLVMSQLWSGPQQDVDIRFNFYSLILVLFDLPKGREDTHHEATG